MEQEGGVAADFVIVTALEEERDAVLAKLPGHRQLPPDERDVRIYYECQLQTSSTPPTSYGVVALTLLGMGRVEAVNATKDAIARWQPRYVLLVGIAGGVKARGVALGDVLVSEQVVDYELQKLRADGPEIRWQVHRADPRLLNAAKSLRADDWQALVQEPRPVAGTPKRHNGSIATGDKVAAVAGFLEGHRAHWPTLVGIEMEAGGVSSACFQSARPPGFFMVRGVSDLADESKDRVEVQSWRAYACDVAASFAVALLRSRPIPNRTSRIGLGLAAGASVAVLAATSGALLHGRSEPAAPSASALAASHRLQILRDFVPRISDPSVRFSERCIALAECINASVFRDVVAFEKTAELVGDAPDSLEEQRAGFPQLADALAPLAPDRLDFVAIHFASARGDLEQTQPRRQGEVTFWWEVFQRSMASHVDETLRSLSTAPFVIDQYAHFDELCANLPPAIVAKMEAHPSRIVQGLAVMQILGAKSPNDPRALDQLRNLVEADSDDNVRLAAQMYRRARYHGVVDAPLAAHALRTIREDAHAFEGTLHVVGKGPPPRLDRLHAAEEYLVYAGEFRAVAETVEGDLVQEAEQYTKYLRSLGAKMPEWGNGDLYARACIRALVSLNRAMFGIRTTLRERVSDRVRGALEGLFSVPHEVLDRVNLAHLAAVWALAVKGVDYDP